MKKTNLLILMAILSAGGTSRAGVDAPGQVWLDYVASDEPIRIDPSTSPDELPSQPMTSQAYFSSDASAFGAQGVLVWTNLSLSHLDGDRHATLIMDLDISGARLGDEYPLSANRIAVEYVERLGDRIVFEGRGVLENVYLVGWSHHRGDDGAVEGRFSLVLADARDPALGSRALLTGGFLTDPAPRSRSTTGGPIDRSDAPSGPVESGCGADDDYDIDWTEDDEEEDEYSDDDSEDSGCEGDTWDDDDDDDSDWEGDTYDDESDWEGDTWVEADWALTSDPGTRGPGCATAPGRRRSNPLRGLMRFLPEGVGLAFIAWMRRRRR